MSKILFLFILIGGAMLMPAQSFNMNGKGFHILLILAGSVPALIGGLVCFGTQANTDGRALGVIIFLIGFVLIGYGFDHL